MSKNRLTKAKKSSMIKELTEDVDMWPYEDLITWAKWQLKGDLEGIDDSDLLEIYERYLENSYNA